MKKTLFVTTNPELGGAQKWTYEQIILLVDNYEVYLSTGNNGWLTKEAKKYCKEMLIDKRLYSFSSLGYLFQLWKFTKKNKIDILIASSANAGIYARLINVLVPSVSVVYVSHGWSAIYRGNRLYQWIEKLLSYISSSILVVSQSDYDKATNTLHISPKKLKLIENSIFPFVSNQKSEYNIKNVDRLCIVMVARFDAPKRQDILIEAAKQIPYMDFYFVGEGSQMASLQKDAPLNVKFLGALKSVEAVLQQSDICVLLSNSEGMPLAVLEGLALAKPLLLSNIPSMHAFIKNNGLLVENSIDAVVSALHELEKKDLKILGQVSKKIFNAQFNLEIKKQEYLDYYQSI